MKEIVLVSGVFTALAALIAIVLAGIGTYAVLTGKCTLCRDKVTGKYARLAGVFMLLPLAAGVVTLPIFEPATAVYSLTARVFMPVLAATTITLAVFLAMRQRKKALAEA